MQLADIVEDVEIHINLHASAAGRTTPRSDRCSRGLGMLVTGTVGAHLWGAISPPGNITGFLERVCHREVNENRNGAVISDCEL